MQDNTQTLCIGKPAPRFEGEAYFKGKFLSIDSDAYRGKYLVLFFYPLDFTFVCPTEILTFNENARNFESNNAMLIGCSVDSKFSHMKWCQAPLEKGGLVELDFPLLSDITKDICKSYRCLMEFGPNRGVSLRATFIIDTKGILRHMSYNDLSVGRSIDEILRLVQAFQYSDENGDVCPSKWKKKGDKTMKPTHDSKVTEDYFKNTHGK